MSCPVSVSTNLTLVPCPGSVTEGGHRSQSASASEAGTIPISDKKPDQQPSDFSLELSGSQQQNNRNSGA